MSKKPVTVASAAEALGMAKTMAVVVEMYPNDHIGVMMRKMQGALQDVCEALVEACKERDALAAKLEALEANALAWSGAKS